MKVLYCDHFTPKYGQRMCILTAEECWIKEDGSIRLKNYIVVRSNWVFDYIIEYCKVRRKDSASVEWRKVCRSSNGICTRDFADCQCFTSPKLLKGCGNETGNLKSPRSLTPSLVLNIYLIYLMEPSFHDLHLLRSNNVVVLKQTN